jgi:hypothetical protein
MEGRYFYLNLVLTKVWSELRALVCRTEGNAKNELCWALPPTSWLT